MPRSTPEEKAIADVEKAIKETDKAFEKHEALQEKADAAYQAAKRAEKTLRWTTSHPDLPDDFDLDEFRRSLEAPFDIEVEAELVGDAIESGEIDPDALEEQDEDVQVKGQIALDEDDDDPFADAA